MLSKLDEYAAQAREELERIHQSREAAYTTSRQVVQSASATIKQVHRQEWDEADAALAASIFHYGQHTVEEVKHAVEARGVTVRWSS